MRKNVFKTTFFGLLSDKSYAVISLYAFKPMILNSQWQKNSIFAKRFL